MVDPTVVVLFTNNPLDEDAFMSSYDDKSIILKCEVIDTTNSSTVLEDILVQISKYMSLYKFDAERVTFIINDSVARHFEFDKSKSNCQAARACRYNWEIT